MSALKGSQEPLDDLDLANLTHKQALFVQEYLIDLNATQAAIRAGYSESTAYSIGNENLKKPEIREAIQKAMDLRAKRTEITADRVLVELAKLGFSDIRQILTKEGGLRDLSCLNDDIAAAVQSVEVITKQTGKDDSEIEYVHKIKLADKKAALELLGKNLKLFADRVEHTGKDGGPIETKELSKLELARLIAHTLKEAENER